MCWVRALLVLQLTIMTDSKVTLRGCADSDREDTNLSNPHTSRGVYSPHLIYTAFWLYLISSSSAA